MKLEQNGQPDNPMGRKYLYSCPFKVLMRFMMSIGPFSYAPSQLYSSKDMLLIKCGIAHRAFCPDESVVVEGDSKQERYH